MTVGGSHMALFNRSDDKTTDNGSGSDDMVSFDDDAYAWWADRDELERKFVPKKRQDPRPHSGRPKAGEPPVSDSGDSEFAKRYSTESLFNWASSPEPDDPTHGGTGLPIDPYLVLGLRPGASLSDVVAAHRSLAKRYHPDQFFQASPDEQHEAAQKMSTINAAYQELRSRLMAHRHSR